jgi:hypothetical protein
VPRELVRAGSGATRSLAARSRRLPPRLRRRRATSPGTPLNLVTRLRGADSWFRRDADYRPRPASSGIIIIIIIIVIIIIIIIIR